MATFTFVLWYFISIAFGSQCADQPMKNDLLAWYEEWMRGFQVDYIAISDLRDAYDFIIVGAGIGGSIVAHRLAMDASYPKVLLLEAGSKHNTSGLSAQMVPVMVAANQLSDIDWAYQSEPSDGHCCKWHKQRRHQIPRGKVTGGTAILNYMVWVRGHKEDWDVLFDVDGWKWNDVLPFYEKTESLHRHNHQQCHKVRARGCDGPIIVNDARNLVDKNSIFDEAVVNAFIGTKKFKYLRNGQNSVTGSNIGVAYTEYNIDDTGHRNDAFLDYNKYMRHVYATEYGQGLINLDILSDAHVTKILFAEDSSDLLQATGVQFADLNDNKKLYTVDLSQNEKSEVILGGGSINDPQLLMLSGLGPKEELNKHDIKVVRDIAGIGNNLQDHTFSFMRYHIAPKYQYSESITAAKVQRTLSNFTLFKDYLFTGKSVLSTSTPNVNAFIRSHVMNAKYGTKHKYPDLQFYVLAGWSGVGVPFNKPDSVLVDYECGKAEYYKDLPNVDNIMTIVSLQHPESRGWIKLKSSDPFDYPLIQPNYLKEQFDVDAIMEGHKIMNEIMLQPSIKRLWDERMECKKYGDVVSNDTNLERFIRDSCDNLYHPVGTCKMGDIAKDKMAVVDNKLLVVGTMNLRVADASILPHQLSGNTQASIYMIGEKASHIILKRWNSRQ